MPEHYNVNPQFLDQWIFIMVPLDQKEKDEILEYENPLVMNWIRILLRERPTITQPSDSILIVAIHKDNPNTAIFYPFIGNYHKIFFGKDPVILKLLKEIPQKYIKNNFVKKLLQNNKLDEHFYDMLLKFSGREYYLFPFRKTEDFSVDPHDMIPTLTKHLQTVSPITTNTVPDDRLYVFVIQYDLSPDEFFFGYLSPNLFFQHKYFLTEQTAIELEKLLQPYRVSQAQLLSCIEHYLQPDDVKRNVYDNIVFYDTFQLSESSVDQFLKLYRTVTSVFPPEQLRRLKSAPDINSILLKLIAQKQSSSRTSKSSTTQQKQQTFSSLLQKHKSHYRDLPIIDVIYENLFEMKEINKIPTVRSSLPKSFLRNRQYAEDLKQFLEKQGWKQHLKSLVPLVRYSKLYPLFREYDQKTSVRPSVFSSGRPSIKMVQEEKKQEKKKTLSELLREFLETEKKQQIVSSTGVMTPVYQHRLDAFLKQHDVERPRRIISLLKKIIRHKIEDKSNINVKKELKTMLFQDWLVRLLEQGGSMTVQKPIQSVKSVRRSIVPASSIPQQIIQQENQQQSVQSKPLLRPLVQRTKKTRQSQLGANIVEVNIDRILYHSPTFQQLAETICQVVRSKAFDPQHNIQTIVLVDSPNVLRPVFSSFRQRESIASHRSFLHVIASKIANVDLQHTLFISISQMNRQEWKNDDPISFSPIYSNTMFSVRVGCFDDVHGTDCHRSPQTNYQNECDDFVRLDLMARIRTILNQDDLHPEIIQITADKMTNWSFLSQSIDSSILTLNNIVLDAQDVNLLKRI